MSPITRHEEQGLTENNEKLTFVVITRYIAKTMFQDNFLNFCLLILEWRVVVDSSRRLTFSYYSLSTWKVEIE